MGLTRKTKKSLHRKTLKHGGGPPKAPSGSTVAGWTKWIEKYKAYLQKEGKTVPTVQTWEEHEARYRNSSGERWYMTPKEKRSTELKWMHDSYRKLTGKAHKTLPRP